MKKIDEFWLCSDCTIAAVNGDYTGLNYFMDHENAVKREEEIQKGLEKLGPNLVCDSNLDADPCDLHSREDWVEAVVAGATDESWERWAEDQCGDDGYDEFSRAPCDCCGSLLAGSRFLFTKWEDE